MKQKLQIIFLFILVASYTSMQLNAQNTKVIDSLINAINVESVDSNKVNILNELCSQNLRSETEKARQFSLKALSIAKQINFKKGMAISYRMIGVANHYLGNADTAIWYYNEALKIAKQRKDSDLIYRCYSNLGSDYMQKGNYDKATAYYQEALKIGIERNDTVCISSCSNNLGIVYRHQGKYAEAIAFYKKSLAMDTKVGDKLGMAAGYTNLGIVYKYQGNYDKAIENYKKSLKIDRELNDLEGISSDLNNIGSVHGVNGDFIKAKEYFQQSLEISIEQGNKRSIAVRLLNLGEAYLNLEEFSKASANYQKALSISTEIGEKHYVTKAIALLGEVNMKQGNYSVALDKLREALRLAKEVGSVDWISNIYLKLSNAYFEIEDYSNAIRNCLNSLEIAQKIDNTELEMYAAKTIAKSYAKQNNFKKAYQYHVLYKDLNDSVFSIESKKKIASIESVFELERKENEIELQQIQIAKKDMELLNQKTTYRAMIGSSVALMLVLIMLIFLIRSRQQKKTHMVKEELVDLRQKMLAQQLNPHFIFNTLNSIQYYINNNDKAASIEFLTSFAKLMRTSLDFSQLDFITLNEEINFLTNYLELEQRRLNNSFKFKFELSESVDGSKVGVPPFIIQPSIENAIKHGLAEKKNGLIEVSFSVQNGCLYCVVKDNGTGMVDGKEHSEHKSMASNLTKRRLKILEKAYHKKANFTLSNWTENNETGCIANYELPLMQVIS